MFINLTNHPSSKWSEEQRREAEKLSREIVDYPFPEVDPNWDEKRVWQEAQSIAEDITEKWGTNIYALVQGEFTLTYALVTLLSKKGIKCMAATTTRIVKEKAEGIIERKFKFCRFRYYLPYEQLENINL